MEKAFFFVAEEVGNEMTVYKVPNELRGLLEVFKGEQISLKTATLPQFKNCAVKWFHEFEGGIALLSQIKPYIVSDRYGFRLAQFPLMLNFN